MAEGSVKEVQSVIDRYISAYVNRSLNELSSCVATDEDLMAFGTDKDESWAGWKGYSAAADTLFRVAKEISWKRGKTSIVFARCGQVAWFCEELSGRFVTGGNQSECAFRLSGTAENRDGKWVIVQFHRSVPVEGCAVPYLETHGVRFFE